MGMTQKCTRAKLLVAPKGKVKSHLTLTLERGFFPVHASWTWWPGQCRLCWAPTLSPLEETKTWHAWGGGGGGGRDMPRQHLLVTEVSLLSVRWRTHVYNKLGLVLTQWQSHSDPIDPALLLHYPKVAMEPGEEVQTQWSLQFRIGLVKIDISPGLVLRSAVKNHSYLLFLPVSVWYASSILTY